MFDFNGMVALAGMCSFSDFFVNIFFNVVILNCLTQWADRTFNELKDLSTRPRLKSKLQRFSNSQDSVWISVTA